MKMMVIVIHMTVLLYPTENKRNTFLKWNIGFSWKENIKTNPEAPIWFGAMNIKWNIPFLKKKCITNNTVFTHNNN